MTKSKILLIASLTLFQIGVLLCLFTTIVTGLVVLAVAFLFHIIWLAVGRISPYKNSPYKHMPNWLIYRRSFRVKFAVSALIIFFAILQLDFGFVAMKKPWAGDVSFTWFAGSAAIGIIVYLLRDFVVNRRTGVSKQGNDHN
jgi:hypothetical protein